MQKSLKEIVTLLGGKIVGEDVAIERVASIAHATPMSITFIADNKYEKALKETKASAVILSKEHETKTDLPKIVTDNPYAYFAKVSALLNPPALIESGIHSTAIIGESVRLGEGVSIGAHVVIGNHVELGHHVVIGPGSVIGDQVAIGDDSKTGANVSIYHGSIIGKRCYFASGAVIGADGFGYASDQGAWVKIPQVGRVRIEDDVDVGANTTIDRGALDDTIIEQGVKLDNLIQIGHNCRIGAHTVIAGCVGIAGSADIGRHCMIGGAAMILGHLKIADKTTISPGTMITRSIKEPATYTALMPFQTHKEWLKTAAHIRQINSLNKRIEALEKIVNDLKGHY
jgi:UDP-3-O-[3-hydroxymyristoyl] glucosamine N-acyltransferase